MIQLRVWLITGRPELLAILLTELQRLHRDVTRITTWCHVHTNTQTHKHTHTDTQTHTSTCTHKHTDPDLFYTGSVAVECVIARLSMPRAGSGVVRIDPLRFLAGCRTRQLNQVCLSYILAYFIVLLFIRAPFLCIVSFRCYVFRLLVVLAKLSLLAK